MTWPEKVQKGYLSEKQQVSPFPDRKLFCFNRGKFSPPEFKFHEQLGPWEGTLKWQETAVKPWRKL